jgi:hypothetical protein
MVLSFRIQVDLSPIRSRRLFLLVGSSEQVEE